MSRPKRAAIPAPTDPAPGPGAADWSPSSVLAIQTFGARHAHDPTIVRDDDGTYVMFSTDACGGAASDSPGTMRTPVAGAHLRTSPDLVNWTWHGTALDGVPPAARAWTKATGLWAPEVVRWPTPDGHPRFHMYYSASTFGSNTSAIGLAVADRLLGPWHDTGIVVRTRSSEQSQNAIDAAVTWDENGTPWLTYGSFFSGIFTLRLDSETGRPAAPGDLGQVIARRPHSVAAAIEGAYLLRRPGCGGPVKPARGAGPDYLLFTSFDSLFSSYSVRVAGADTITGPYRDRSGALMTDLTLAPDSIGTRVLVGHQLARGPGWLAPGHCSVLSLPPSAGGQAEGDFLVHHVRLADNPTEHTAQIRRLVWTRSGWPAVSPQPYAGTPAERAEPVGAQIRPEPRLVGRWDVLDLRDTPANSGSGPVTRSRLIDLPDGDLRNLDADDIVVHATVNQATGAETLSFAGYTAEGTAISGTLIAAEGSAAPGLLQDC